jgi:hypothetical protein
MPVNLSFFFESDVPNMPGIIYVLECERCHHVFIKSEDPDVRCIELESWPMGAYCLVILHFLT